MERNSDILWEDGDRLYRRVWRDIDGDRREFLVAEPSAQHPTPDTINRLAHEYGLKDYLDSSWAVQPLELVRERGQTVLLLEPTSARPVNQIIGSDLSVEMFLRVAIAATNAVAQLHKSGLIHKDLKASNILIDAASAARLTGFGIASRLPRERQTVEPPELIAGTLSHMAPEQTGRMNRSVDSRSDLYSLGVTLYQTLTGNLPFNANEPMEWVHCHIARKPALPKADRGKIPPQVIAILMKLLEKTPEERYQTAVGVQRDLQRCLDEWQSRGVIEEFSLGTRDQSDRLMIPEKLYGREREIETLVAAFDAAVASANPQIVLVSGYSGIGKSSVVNELHKVLVHTRGLFAQGKFDQFKRDIPYATLAQAFQTLIRQLLSKPQEELDEWGDQLRQALEPNAVLLLDLIPELKFVIGEQPPVPDVPPVAAKTRFQITLRRLIGVFARAEHPLALFFDDLQWLDEATLDLLENILLEPESQHLLIVGAYRNNEVDPTHPLLRKLSVIRESGVSVREIVLGPLEDRDVIHWLADALHCLPDEVLRLAQLIHEKTAGNPFFANQFLQELVHDDLLTFNASDVRWRWELEPIRSKGYTDNVIDFMVGKLSRLSVASQEALKGLAYFGSSAPATTLAMVLGTSVKQLHFDLWEALRLELIVHNDDSYRFVHDRVQEAAYSLIDEKDRAAGHLRIGRILTTQITSDAQEEAVFEIVGHFNRASSLISSHAERERVATLNLAAGKRAMKAAAFGSALTYLVDGSELLDQVEQQHSLAFELDLHRAECEFLTGEVASAEQRLKQLSLRATSVVERAAVVCLQADVYYALQQPHRGLEEATDCLREAGLDISLSPSEEQARAVYGGILAKLDGVRIDEIAGLPLMSDPTARAVLDVLVKISPTAASLKDDNFQILIAANAVDLTLERGLHDGSSFAFVWLGYLAGWSYGDFDTSFRFGELGYELIERKNLRRFEGYICLMYSTLMLPWAKHVRMCRSVIDLTFEVSRNTGDRMSAVASRNILLSNLLLAGDPLVDVQREAQDSLAFCQSAAFVDYTDAVATQAALVRNLRGLMRQFGLLDDDEFDERRMENHFATEPHVEAMECWYWIRKLQARYLAGDYEVALDASRHAQRLLAQSPGMLERAEHELYSALTHAAMCDAQSNKGHMKAVIDHHQQLEVWARYCPANFENRALLVAAEIARLENRDLDAMGLYEQAIRSACDNGFVHNEAVGYEHASVFYRTREFTQFADLYLRNARDRYAVWGADGKVRQLDQLYPDLKLEQSMEGYTSTITARVEELDLATVIRVSQAVSGEIVLEKLLDTVMRKAMEHAGAERGLLILLHDDQLLVVAEASIDRETLSVRTTEEPISFSAIPESVLRYVVRTQDPIIIDDASVTKSFSTEEYLRENQTRSVACLPLLKHGELIGLLYLENNLASNVFTPARLKILEVIASQAAISLENSRLYHEIQRAGEAIRRSEKQFRDVIDTMPAMAFTTLPDGTTDFVNRRFSNFTGLTANSARASERTLIHPDDVETHSIKWQSCLTNGEPFENEVRYRGKDGQHRWFLVRGEPLRDEQGTRIKWFVTLTDIEDRKAAEERIRNENVILREEIVHTSMLEEIVGTSAALQGVLAQVAKVAPTDSTVLVTGETGTGKELIARAIHKKSSRSGLAFVAVNCAAIPRELIASELFGHEKGAFTGATQQRLGRFELANGGSIFLDEVGELPAETQIALLRVLQEREFERVGGTRRIHVDVRVIAATNRDLEAAISAGAFRSDLYYRLLVFPIKVPSLRERSEDIPLLVEYFIERYARKAGKYIKGVEKKTLELLQSYHWPGNIRELQNVIERSLILCETEIFSIDKSWLPQPALAAGVKTQTELSQTLLEQEKNMIETALRECRGRVFGPSGAASRLGIPRSTLESKIRALKIDKNRFKSANPS